MAELEPTSHEGIEKQVIVREGQIDGVLEISVVSVEEGKEVGLHGHDYIETWQILSGVGLMRIQQEGSETKKNVRIDNDFEPITTYPGDLHGVTNIGAEQLRILVTKLP